MLVGNVVLYGATSGEAFFNGMAGERFAVRNSGATAVVEAVGDHGCEYMTRGIVVVLGPTGRNFAAGMTGGLAYVLDQSGEFTSVRANRASVDLEPVTDPAEAKALRILITRHCALTGSPRAAWVLAHWLDLLPSFVKVFPHEYKRVLGSPSARTSSVPVFAREAPERRPVPERLDDFLEVYQAFPEEKVQRQGARCMDCGVPFCHTGCPLNNVIPDFNDLAHRDRWQAAIRLLHSTNNFPEFTGRICPAPCEAACVLGINEPPVTIKLIEQAIVERAFREGWIRPQPPATRTGKRVAIVGSGPAGLAAAQQLNRAGHSVTVFEKADRLGGLLRYGVPDFKMPKHLIDRRLEQLTAEGVQFQLGAHVGRNVPVEDLRKEFDALLLAGGAEQPRDLRVPGRELKGIHFAMEFLPQQNHRCVGDRLDFCGEILATGKRVVIIGGGDTGADCLGTALRQKPLSVHQLEILPQPPEVRAPQTPWPLWPLMLRVESSHEEGGVREWAVTTTSFSGDEHGHVARIHAVRDGAEFTLDVDLVLLAMGFLGPVHNGMIDDLGVALDQRGSVATGQNHMTSMPGIFAAGDMRRGQSLVVWAIEEGRAAARGIDRYLLGETGRLSASVSR